MRIDLTTVINQAEHLVHCISTKSRSRSMQAAHDLLCCMPSPCWAETAPGCTIYYGNEASMAIQLELLRYSALTWLRGLIDPDVAWEPNSEWPAPSNLVQAIRGLSEFKD